MLYISNIMLNISNKKKLNVNNRIKEYRARHNITQIQLADALGITRQTIIFLEQGKYSPSLQLAFSISSYFKVNIGDIFYLDEEGGEV